MGSLDRWLGLLMDAIALVGLMRVTLGGFRDRSSRLYAQLAPKGTGRRRWLQRMLGVAVAGAATFFFMGASGLAYDVLSHDGTFPSGVITFEDKRVPEDQSYSRDDAQYNVFAVNADGTNARQVTHTADEGWPAYLPADDVIVHVRKDPDGSWRLAAHSARGDSVMKDVRFTEQVRRPAVHPLGDRIAVESGDAEAARILVVDVDGGDASEFPGQHEGGSNRFPAWSPDGSKLAYVATDSDASVIRICDAETGEVLTSLGGKAGQTYLAPVFSSDGQAMACTILADGVYRIYSGALPSQDEKTWRGEFLSAESRHTHSPAYSPDGAWLAYLASEGGAWHLVVRNLSSNEVRRVTDGLAGPGSWSPDSRSLCFAAFESDRMSLQTYDVVTDAVETLTTAGHGQAQPALSDDGAVMITTGPRWNSVSERFEYVLNVQSASGHRVLDELALGVQLRSWPQTAISGDGARIALVSAAQGKYEGQLWVADVAGGNASRVALDYPSCSKPSWFPGGEKLAFQSRERLQQVVTLDLDGGLEKARTLSDGTSNDRDPQVSPDGRWIAFVSDRDGEVDGRGADLDRVYVMTAGGMLQYRLDDGGSDYSYRDPYWSPDGSALTLTASRWAGDEWEHEVQVWSLRPAIPLLGFPVVRHRYSLGQGAASCWSESNPYAFAIGDNTVVQPR